MICAICSGLELDFSLLAYMPATSEGSRRMSSGTDFLNYALYKDAARTQVWGTGMTGGTTLTYNSASKASTAVTVYGKVPQAQDVTVGSYADVVVATINY